MDFKKFYNELIRRNVFRAVLAYLAVAWVLIEFASVLLPTFEAPPYLLQGLIYLLAIGLIFWTGFAWVYDLTSEGWKKTPDWEDNTETRAANTRRLNTVIAVSGITAILLLLAGSFWAGSQWNSDAGYAYSPEYNIAVIPLNTITSESDDSDYLKDGLTQSLIEALSGNHALLVLNMGSTRYFTAGMIPDNPYLAERSENIDYFISGSLEKKGNAISVVVELRRALGQPAFWTKNYAKDMAEIEELWDQVAKDIFDMLGLRSEVSTSRLSREIRSIRPETFELYLKGKYYLSKSTVEEWQRGMVYLQEAIDRNPADPDAYASMAEGYITWGHSLMPPDDVFPKALAASKRAIQLDSTNAQGWATLADYHTYFGWDWELADYAFKRADSLNPNMALNHYHRSWYLALFGRMNEAIDEHKRAQQLDPFTPMHTAWMAELYRWVGQYELGMKELDKVFEMSTGQYALAMVLKGMILADQGKVDKGLEIMQQACEINKGWYIYYGPYLYRHGRIKEGNEVLQEVKAFPETSFFNLTLASIYHAAGDLDKTFEHLEKAKRHAWYPWMVRIYLADEAFQQDPRYWEYLKELNLPAPDALEYDPGT